MRNFSSVESASPHDNHCIHEVYNNRFVTAKLMRIDPWPVKTQSPAEKNFCVNKPAIMRTMPNTVDSKMASSSTKYNTSNDKNGVTKAKLVTFATVEERLNADCHKTKVMPISNKPI